MTRLGRATALGLAVAALLFTACGDDDTPDGGPDEGISELGVPQDLPPLDIGRLVDDGVDQRPICACTAATECCDGCAPINAGEWCSAGGDQWGKCSGITGTCRRDAPDTPVTCAADACNDVDVTQLPSCALTPSAEKLGNPCDDGSAVTFGDECVAGGACRGWICVDTPPCVSRSWDGTECVATLNAGADCNDGDATTHTDLCQSDGACRGTPCECTSGPCCDGCFFRGTDHVCEAMRPALSACSSGAGECGQRGIETRHVSVSCSGASASCDGAEEAVLGSIVTTCETGFGCFDLNPEPFQAECVACP